LLPDHVRVPWQELRTAVAEMGGQRRAGGNRGLDLSRRRGGVADRDADTGGNERFGQRDGARNLGRERDEHDPPTGGVLTTPKIVHRRREDVRPWMRSAWSVVRR